MNKITAVVGGQYGSEGKGVIVHHLADEYDVHIRTGGPNAGHSFDQDGVIFKHQSLPCGWTNPAATLVLGRGALVDPHQLLLELETVSKYDRNIWDRLVIDADAMLLEQRHHDIEGGVGGGLHRRIGSTGEGVGAARMARVSRDPSLIRRAGDGLLEYDRRFRKVLMGNTPRFLHGLRNAGKDILLEGTQGSGLSLIHGPWPYVTSADTNAATLAADAGIPPHHITDVILVVRSHPIRVAGNSGPLANETTWEEISEKRGKKTIEQTTVTKLVRRVGEWDEKLVADSITLNGPTALALTFADYINVADEGKTEYSKLSPETLAFVNYLESWFQIPVDFIGTGGKGWRVVDRRR